MTTACFPACLIPFLLAGLGIAAGDRAAPPDLAVSPRKVAFTDAYDGRQLLVSEAEHDITRAARYSSSDPAVVQIDDRGYLRPAGDGVAQVLVRHGSAEARVSVRVSGFRNGRAIDFRTEIVPLLSRLGCNAGGCHGKASGQNGFKLSLFGSDPAFDYEAIVREARGRRIFPAAPAQSMVLRKAAGQVPHGGGKRLLADSEEYRLIRRWIESGTPASGSGTAAVARLRVSPADRVLKYGEAQQLAVVAVYADGGERDVTRQAEYFGNLDTVATVDRNGWVEARQHSGEAALMARYIGHVAVFRAIVPHGEPLKDIPDFKATNYIDELAVARWKKLGLRPSPSCDDATFLRRITVDLCGRLPTAGEARAFLAGNAADNRARLIDKLLDSPDYPAYFAMRWGSILRNSNLAGANQAAYAFHDWIKDQIARNRPYDEFVRGIVAAAGEWQDAPAVNWYWQMRDDQLHQVTADTAQVFLGVRLQCARCHHHPYERWSQDDYYGLSGFFTRLGRKSFGEPPPYYAASSVTTGEKDPRSGLTPQPKYPDGPAAKFAPEEDPRHALVDWMAKPDNPFFTKALVNRLWGHFLGRGLYDEVDDMRDSNPPSNPELLDALAKDFVRHKFDVKHVIRTIVNSSVYQLSAEPTDANRMDRQNFARYYARRMLAEVFFDAVNQATGAKANFAGMAAGARALDLPHEGFGSYFLDTFDRPRRVTGCECERSSGATLAQVLLLANSEEVENKLRSGDGLVAKLVKAKKTTPEVVEELYLTAYARRPTKTELQKAIAYVGKQENRQQGLEDVLWVIVNSKEFMFNH
jgi:Protein of unknown function (DUF1553)/Protein of unknown function (DUF1549)